MAELDAFEARFAAAYRRYLDEAPTAVDAVAVARAIATEDRRTAGWSWPWALAPARALAWLVLVALLVAALGLAVFVGAHRSAVAFSCPAGADPNRAGPTGQVRPPVAALTAPIAFDRHAGRLVLAAGHDSGNPETWTFDVCANTWTRMHPQPEALALGSIRQLVYDVDSDLTLAIGWDRAYATDRVWAYDLEEDRWVAKRALPMALERQLDMAYDAATGLVVVLSSTSAIESDPWELWTYDVETDTWTPIHQTGGPSVAPDHAFQWLAYDASVDRLVWNELSTPATWLLDARTGTWSRSGSTPLRVNVGYGSAGGEMAYDEATHRTVVFSRGRIIAYDAGADRWDALVGGWDPAADPPSSDSYPRYTDRFGSALAYDPVNRRILVYGGTYPTAEVDSDGAAVWAAADDVLAFDPATGRWLTLLEQSPASSAH